MLCWAGALTFDLMTEHLCKEWFRLLNNDDNDNISVLVKVLYRYKQSKKYDFSCSMVFISLGQVYSVYFVSFHEFFGYMPH